MHTPQANRLPSTRQHPLFSIMVGVSLLVALPYLLGLELPVFVELGVFAFFVILTGIPHGAVDHIVAADVYGLKQTIRDQFTFYGVYLLTMLVIGALWVVYPVAGFVLFIVISVYHFGQGDLAYLSVNNIQVPLYISRGLFLLTLPILLHLDITAPIIAAATGISESNLMLPGMVVLRICLIVTVFHVGMILALRYLSDISWYNILRELIFIATLGIVFVFANPLVAFGVYFGLWHGLNHFFELRDHLSEDNRQSSFFGLYKKTIPFTLISFVGMGILWFGTGALGLQHRMISLLFILISVLTLPHMLLIDRMYRKNHSE